MEKEITVLRCASCGSEIEMEHDAGASVECCGSMMTAGLAAGEDVEIDEVPRDAAETAETAETGEAAEAAAQDADALGTCGGTSDETTGVQPQEN